MNGSTNAHERKAVRRPSVNLDRREKMGEELPRNKRLDATHRSMVLIQRRGWPAFGRPPSICNSNNHPSGDPFPSCRRSERSTRFRGMSASHAPPPAAAFRRRVSTRPKSVLHSKIRASAMKGIDRSIDRRVRQLWARDQSIAAHSHAHSHARCIDSCSTRAGGTCLTRLGFLHAAAVSQQRFCCSTVLQ